MTTEPTDDELDEVLCNQWPAFSMQATLVRMWVRQAMRDAIARWGQPSGAGEPVAPEQIDALEALAKRHGALSYRNRADTANPAFGFSVAGLKSLLAEVRKEDTELIRQLVEALETACGDRCNAEYNPCYARVASAAGRARLEGTP